MKEEDYIRESLNYHLKVAEILSFVILTLTIALLSDSMWKALGTTIQMDLVGVEMAILLLGVGNEFRLAKIRLDELRDRVNGQHTHAE